MGKGHGGAAEVQAKAGAENIGPVVMALADLFDPAVRKVVASKMTAAAELKNATGEAGWPKVYKCRFIEPGLAHYEDIDGQGAEETILVQMPALDKMAPTFPGKPVINLIHKDVTPGTVAAGQAEGVVSRVWKEDGWWWCEFVVWDDLAQRNCESGAYSVSCAYEPDPNIGGPGKHHNVDYQSEVLDGQYTHLAIVANPRYEGAKIYVNSKGGVMAKGLFSFFTGKEKKNAVDIGDPSQHAVDVDGAQVSLNDLLAAAPAPAPQAPVINDDTVVEKDGKSFTIGELKDAYRNKMKAANEAGAAAAAAKKADEERQNAEKAAADKAAAEKAEAEKKNAEEAGKAAAEKAKAEEEKERQNALNAEKAEAEKARLAAGRLSFAALQNAARLREGGAQTPVLVTKADRIAAGQKKYGSSH